MILSGNIIFYIFVTVAIAVATASVTLFICWLVLKSKRVVLSKSSYQALIDNNEKLADAEKRANDANKAKSDFLSSMSHEIRTPMNTVLGMNELIRMTLADASLSIGEKINRVIGYSDDIQHSGEALLYIINDILDISRIESGKFEIRPEGYHIHKLMDDMVPLFRLSAEGKNLIFNYEVDDELPGYIEGDSVRVRQIITNIVNNAIKYTKDGSVSLSVSGRVEGETVIYDIEVSDTGIGIRSENVSHLFESFERVDSAETHYIEGTGLGLTIVKSLLDIMGGSVEVESEYGVGSTFTVHIPQKILSNERISEYRPETGTELSESKRYYINGKKILVVDDNLTNLTVAKSFLEQMHADTDTATNGKEALKLISEKKYELILLDHMMPEMSGVKVIKKIRRNPENYLVNKDTPYIVMTANAIVGAKERYIDEYGFDDYIAKPFRFAELVGLMSTYIEGDKYTEDELIDQNAGKAPGQSRAPAGIGGPPPGAIGEVGDIDKEKGIEACGDERTYHDVAEAYLETEEENRSNMETYVRTNDWENYRIVVHALKSSSLTIGAMQFAGFSKTVEGAAADLLEEKDVEKNLGYLRGSFAPYLAAYASVCENLKKNV